MSNVVYLNETQHQTAIYQSPNVISVAEAKPIEVPKLGDCYDFPPGLLGEIAQYIYQSAPYPSRQVALAAAIGLMAGICGRAYNIEGSELNQYQLVLGHTGTGKNSLSTGTHKLMGYVVKAMNGASEFIGPGDFSSGQAVHRSIADSGSLSYVSIASEFGHTLQRLNSVNAAPHDITLRKILLDLFSSSGYGNYLTKRAYADNKVNIPALKEPAYSIMAESTPSTILGNLDTSSIDNGLLARFNLFECDEHRGDYNKHHYKIKPSDDLVDKLVKLCVNSLQINEGINSGKNEPIIVKVPPDADRMLDVIRKYEGDKLNASNTEATKQLWNRFALRVARLAALVTVGINSQYPEVSVEAIEWAANLLQKGTQSLATKFEKDEIGDQSKSETAQHRILRENIKFWFETPWDIISKKYPKIGTDSMREQGIVPYAFLSKKLLAVQPFKSDKKGEAGRRLRSAIDELVKCGEIIKVIPDEKKQFNTSGELYKVASREQIIAGLELASF